MALSLYYRGGVNKVHTSSLAGVHTHMYIRTHKEWIQNEPGTSCVLFPSSQNRAASSADVLLLNELALISARRSRLRLLLFIFFASGERYALLLVGGTLCTMAAATAGLSVCKPAVCGNPGRETRIHTYVQTNTSTHTQIDKERKEIKIEGVLWC